MQHPSVIPALISTGYVLNVAAVPVTILSVDATPISPEPSPEKDDCSYDSRHNSYIIVPPKLILKYLYNHWHYYPPS